MSRCIAVLVALMVLAGACTSSDEPESSSADPTTRPASRGDGDGGVLRLALVGPDAIDPALIVPTDPNEVVIVDLLFDSLTAIDPETQTAEPAIAESWTVDETGLVWRFELREGATFSNGEPIIGDDIKYTLERVARRAASSFAAARLNVLEGVDEVTALERLDVSGVVVVNDGTVQLTTTSPFPQLPELLAAPSYGIVSRQAFEDPDFEDGIVTSGPFELVDRSEDGLHVRFEPRDGIDVKLDAVESTRYPSASDAYAALEDDQADWVIAGRSQYDDAIEKFGDEQITPFGGEIFFAMNLEDEVLANIELRKAILAGIDRHALAEHLGGRQPLDGIVPPGVPGFVEEACAELCEYDPERAIELVGQVFGEGEVPEIEFTVQDDPLSPVPQKELAEEVQRQLGEVGIPVKVTALPIYEYRRHAVSGEQQLFYYGWQGLFPSPDAYLWPLFRSDAPDNVTRLSSEAVDSLLDSARAQGDREERFKAYEEAERQVLAQVPVVPISNLQTNAVTSESVRDMQMRLDGTFDVTTVWVAD